LLASGSTDGEVFIWDIANPAAPAASKPHAKTGVSSRGVTRVSWNLRVPQIVASANEVCIGLLSFCDAICSFLSLSFPSQAKRSMSTTSLYRLARRVCGKRAIISDVYILPFLFSFPLTFDVMLFSLFKQVGETRVWDLRQKRAIITFTQSARQVGSECSCDVLLCCSLARNTKLTINMQLHFYSKCAAPRWRGTQRQACSWQSAMQVGSITISITLFKHTFQSHFSITLHLFNHTFQSHLLASANHYLPNITCLNYHTLTLLFFRLLFSGTPVVEVFDLSSQ
jgi:hypothetical protein